MSEQKDLLLERLAEQAREDIEVSDRERFGARWDDYAAGRLSDEEAEALVVATEDPDTELAASLFKPLDEQVKTSFAERLQQEIRPQEVSAQDVAEGDLGGPEALAIPQAEAPESRRGALNRLWDWLGIGQTFERKPRLGLAAAVVAGLLLTVSLPLLRQDVEALPPFESKLRGIQEQRSATNEAGDIFRAGHRFDFLLRPDRKVEGPIVTTVIVEDSSGSLQRWRKAEAAVKRSSEGAVFTEGLVWPWGDGEWTLHFFITRDPLQEDDIQRILREQESAGDPPKSGDPSLKDGHWVRERIYVQP